jgi:DNA-binding NarL/FixJ family response regulator
MSAEPELLTDAQRIVFSYLVKGMNNKEIATQTGRTIGVVKTRMTAILKFFNCDSRCRLVAKHYRGEL